MTYMQQMNLHHYLILSTKVNLKLDHRPKHNSETIMPPKITENLYDFELGNNLLDLKTKIQSMKEKTNNRQSN